MDEARSSASLTDGRGEVGEAQGILNGSNFMATSLRLPSNFISELSIALNQFLVNRYGVAAWGGGQGYGIRTLIGATHRRI